MVAAVLWKVNPKKRSSNLQLDSTRQEIEDGNRRVSIKHLGYIIAHRVVDG